jgi:hypothetical protein
MRRIQNVLPLLALLGMALPAGAQGGPERAAHCSTYARNQAEVAAPAGGGLIGGAARGAAGGALFGVIVGGKKGAKRGAGLGGAVGAVSGSVASGQQKQANYQYYYDQCMRGGG